MEFQSEMTGTYSDGVLRPDHRLDLPEGSRVVFKVRAQQPDAKTRAEAFARIERIAREKLVRLSPGKISRDELYDRR